MEFGKLERVELREGWRHEAVDFTPWLSKAENLALLAEEIGRELDFSEAESSVGPFRADIVAKCGDETVVIENQFGKTDHSHLGQLLTYAAGLGTASEKTVVWIAETFQEEHRAALDWLNQTTEPGIRFFGIELQLWKIGSSLPAPKFEVVSRPNDYQKKLTTQAAALSKTEKLYYDFWSDFVAFCDRVGTTLQLRSPQPQHWLATSIGRAGFGVNLVISKQKRWLKCQLWLEGRNAKAAYEQLAEQRSDIETRLGGDVTFDPKPSSSSAEISKQEVADISDRTKWEDCFQWLKREGELFRGTFKPLVDGLDL